MNAISWAALIMILILAGAAIYILVIKPRLNRKDLEPLTPATPGGDLPVQPLTPPEPGLFVRGRINFAVPTTDLTAITNYILQVDDGVVTYKQGQSYDFRNVFECGLLHVPYISSFSPGFDLMQVRFGNLYLDWVNNGWAVVNEENCSNALCYNFVAIYQFKEGTYIYPDRILVRDPSLDLLNPIDESIFYDPPSIIPTPTGIYEMKVCSTTEGVPEPCGGASFVFQV